MSEEPAARPARRTLPRIPLAAAAGAALVVGLVGYAVGNGHSDDKATPTASSSACAAAQDELSRESSAIEASPGDANALRLMANLVIQNNTCFQPKTVAAAQTALDNLNLGAAATAARNAVCAASDEPWWKC